MPFDTRLAGVLAAALTLTGCVGPIGPSPQAGNHRRRPRRGAYRATWRAGNTPDVQIAPLRDQANAQSVGSTLIGAGLGAALGGAIGGGRGAGIGAASGAVLGTGVGAANAQNAAMNLQQQYNMYYANCMSAQGGAAPGGYAQPPRRLFASAGRLFAAPGRIFGRLPAAAGVPAAGLPAALSLQGGTGARAGAVEQAALPRRGSAHRAVGLRSEPSDLTWASNRISSASHSTHSTVHVTAFHGPAASPSCAAARRISSSISRFHCRTIRLLSRSVTACPIPLAAQPA